MGLISCIVFYYYYYYSSTALCWALAVFQFLDPTHSRVIYSVTSKNIYETKLHYMADEFYINTTVRT
jgi:hypothetical protein